jgi:AsmA family protein
MIVAHRNLKWLRTTLLLFGAAVILLAVALIVGAHELRGPLLRVIAARTQREIRVDGRFDLQLLSLHPTLTAEQVSIGNPPWMPAGVTATIGRLVLVWDWKPSWLPLGIRRLELQRAVLNLQRNSAAHANWHMSAAGPGKGPPLMHGLSIPNAQVELHDERRHLQFSGTVSAGAASAGAEAPRLRLGGSGQLNGRSMSFTIDGDALASARADQPYQFTLQERSGTASLEGRGSLTHPFDFRDLHGTFRATGVDLSDIYFLVGLRLPATGPFRLSGRLDRQGKRFAYSQLSVTSGQSDLSGTLTFDGTGSRPRLDGELSSDALRVEDLGARAAGHPPEDTASLRVPDTPLRLAVVKRTDMTVSYRAGLLRLGPEALRSVNAVVATERGILSIEGFKASIGQGSLSGSARLDATRELPSGELNLNAADVPLELMKGTRGDAPALEGSLNGRVQLRGAGASLHDLARSANGVVTVVVPHGTVRASIAEAASLSIVGTLGAVLRTHEQTPLRCAVVSFNAHDGVLTADTLVIDTSKVLITGSGAVRMDSEMLDLTLRGQPKNNRLAMPSVVAIRGTLRHPEMQRLARDMLAATLNTALAPVSALLSFVDPKLPQNADCAALIADAKGASAASEPAAPREH